ncbi:MAG: hypothetical protein WDM96_19250 [Lacunisphaera sp.]
MDAVESSSSTSGREALRLLELDALSAPDLPCHCRLEPDWSSLEFERLARWLDEDESGEEVLARLRLAAGLVSVRLRRLPAGGILILLILVLLTRTLVRELRNGLVVDDGLLADMMMSLG